ncbi:MAG: hypothetical protein J5I81_03455 [Nitrococcus mobilis]|nr:hypothetical protein [Nitrococcus mobilis]
MQIITLNRYVIKIEKSCGTQGKDEAYLKRNYIKTISQGIAVMKTALFANLTRSALVFVVVAGSVNAAQPVRLTPAQMDIATAGTDSLRIISAAAGSQFSQSQGSSQAHDSGQAVGVGQVDSCCGSSNFIKVFLTINGFSFSETFHSSSTSSTTLIPLSGNGVSGKIKIFYGE